MNVRLKLNLTFDSKPTERFLFYYSRNVMKLISLQGDCFDESVALPIPMVASRMGNSFK